MTKEEKQLLLKDLSARLQYGVKVNYWEPVDILNIRYKRRQGKLVGIDMRLSGSLIIERNGNFFEDSFETTRPYLRPMSSMTEEEKELMKGSVICFNELEGNSTLFDEIGLDWLNAHHFDYRGLISMGLALETPEGIYE